MVIIVLLLTGLCLGSFVNALVWRVHEQSKKGKKQSLKPKDLSIVHGRSMCVHCHHTLAWYDLLPVVSWLSLSGKCRYCKKAISGQYPLVELLTAALFVVSYAYWPTEFDTAGVLSFGFWLIFLVGFMALIIYDLRWMLLPNRIVFPMQALAGVYVLVLVITKQDTGVLLTAFWGVLCSAGLFYVLFQISNGKWIGGGDVKLAVVLGALVGGPVHAFLMLFIASLCGSLVGLPLILTGKSKRNSRIPFGPMLILATIIVYLFGTAMINLYKQQLLLA